MHSKLRYPNTTTTINTTNTLTSDNKNNHGVQQESICPNDIRFN